MHQSEVYEMVRLDHQTKSACLHYDCVIIAGESDARAYEVLRNSKAWGLSFDKVLMCDFEERRHSPDAEVRRCYELYKELSFPVIPVSCSLRDPSGCIKSIPRTELKVEATSRVAIDISSFSRPYFFSLLKFLQDFCNLTRVDVFYTEPMSYVIPKGLLRSYRKSIGSLSVTEVPGFPGRNTGKSTNALIVTLGFEGELSAFICDEVTPSSIIVVNGFPAYSPKFKDISLINNERLLNYSGWQERISYCRANNPFELFNLLVGLRRKNPQMFFNIAPLGPKPMALGACMFALSDNSIRVVYPMPETYAGKTTDKCFQSWRYAIPLGDGLKESVVHADPPY